MITIELTPQEIQLAHSHAVVRRIQKLQGLRGDRMQSQRSSWDNEINGACAELALAKWRNVYWSGVAQLRAPDAGSKFEVRWTHHEGTGGLIVYENDKDENYYVLADGYPPRINFVGWLKGSEAKAKAMEVEFGRLVPRELTHEVKPRKELPAKPPAAAAPAAKAPQQQTDAEWWADYDSGGANEHRGH